MNKNKDIEVSILIDFYGKFLKDKQLEIIDCYYNRDLSLAEIADNIGITRQGVLDSIKRSETVLYNLEKSLGAVQHFKNLELKVNEINRLALNIKKENVHIGSGYIDKCADEILKISQSLCD